MAEWNVGRMACDLGLATLLAGSSALALASEARDGQFDPEWGVAGVTLLGAPAGGGYSLDRLYGAVVDPADRLLLFGNARSGGRHIPMILRLGADGQPDVSFGSGGFALVDLAPVGIAGDVVAHGGVVLGDGRVVVIAGRTGAYLLTPFDACGVVFAITSSGALSTDYGPGPGPACLPIGTAPTTVQSFEPFGTIVNVDADRVLIGGPTTAFGGNASAVTRLDVQGRIDASFGIAGLRHYGGTFIGGVYRRPGLVRRGDRIAAGGAVGTSDGVYVGDLSLTPQPGYGSAGVAALAWIMPAALNEVMSFDLEADGTAWLAGFARPDFTSITCNFCITRMTAAGTPDPGFNPSGTQPGSLLLLEPGSQSLVARIVGRGSRGAVMAGWRSGQPLSDQSALVVSIRPDGSLDPRFGSGATPGRVIVDAVPAGDVRGAADAVLDSRGRLLVAIDGPVTGGTAWGAIRLIDQRVFGDGFDGP